MWWEQQTRLAVLTTSEVTVKGTRLPLTAAARETWLTSKTMFSAGSWCFAHPKRCSLSPRLSNLQPCLHPALLPEQSLMWIKGSENLLMDKQPWWHWRNEGKDVNSPFSSEVSHAHGIPDGLHSWAIWWHLPPGVTWDFFFPRQTYLMFWCFSFLSDGSKLFFLFPVSRYLRFTALKSSGYLTFPLHFSSITFPLTWSYLKKKMDFLSLGLPINNKINTKVLSHKTEVLLRWVS